MKSQNLLKQLNSLPYFTKNVISKLGNQLGLENAIVDTYISRYLKHKEIFRLKNGLYVSAEFFDKNKNDLSYSFYLANIIRTPSYISSWSALQYYGLATEAIYSVTSVTTKVTREYVVKTGNYNYHSINKNLFSDFFLMSGKFGFFIASPAKALFDMLYFRTHQFRGLTFEEIKILVSDLRIDIDDMVKTEQEKFYNMIKKYE